MSFPIKLFWVLLLSPLCWCQQPSSDLTARTLFYEEPQDNDHLPSIPAAKSQQARKASVQKAALAGKQSSGTNTEAAATENVSAPSGQEGPSIPEVRHLGLRYNLLLVDQQSGESQPVDSDRVFQPGECVALDLEANHSGYLYVLDRGSSGTWNPLLPSAEMPDESNVVSSRARIRVPQNYCFKIEGPPGEERVFVVLSRNPDELYGLDETIRNASAPAPPVLRQEGAAPVMAAENRLAHEVSKMEGGMGKRDLKIAKIEQAKTPEEPPGSVYIVNASAVPSGKVVTEIRIRHN